jgi:zinc protease
MLRPSWALGLLCALCAPSTEAGSAAPVQAEGFTHVRSLGGIDEYRLESNGLTVLLMPEHSAPVVTFQVTYRVGSRNEVTGTTGATHLLEHLMFKGSERFNEKTGNSLAQYLDRVGASFNATTWLDRTNYFATLGRDSLEGYIAIEADRMRNLWLREEDRKSEMTVVRNEYERGENSPGNALEKEVYAAAYLAQPYHHSTIGWRSDIENVPIEKLREFYDTFYWPDNATVTIVGDVEPAEALALVRKYYGAIPRAPKPIPQVYTQEPPQTGPRRVTVKRAGAIGLLMKAYKGPHARHPDMPALSVLGSVLSSGQNSRLSRGLVDKSLATYASAGMAPTHDPGLFVFRIALTPDVTHEQAEEALLAEIERVKNEGVTAEEVERVIQQYRAGEAYLRDGTMGVASALNEAIAVGDWTLYVTFPERVAKVTAEDVQRVAREYLNEDRSTTGWFVPTKSQ